MLLNTNKFALATAVAAGVLWTVCSVLVMLMPQPMTTMTEHMLHINLPDEGLILSTLGFFAGLLGWVVLAGGFGWLMGRTYNIMAGKSETKA